MMPLRSSTLMRWFLVTDVGAHFSLTVSNDTKMDVVPWNRQAWEIVIQTKISRLRKFHDKQISLDWVMLEPYRFRMEGQVRICTEIRSKDKAHLMGSKCQKLLCVICVEEILGRQALKFTLNLARKSGKMISKTSLPLWEKPFQKSPQSLGQFYNQEHLASKLTNIIRWHLISTTKRVWRLVLIVNVPFSMKLFSNI